MKKIGIIGLGYVGQAIYSYFQDHYEVRYIDPAKEGSNTQKQINECDLAVVCVPTEMRDDGTCDTSIVEEVLGWLKTPVVLIKSTIPPGTTKKLERQFPDLNIAFSPEYIGEGKYYVPTHKGYPHPTDMKQHNFFIFGGHKEVVRKIIPFFLKVSGPDARYHSTDSTTAELVKYAENSWGAMKVTFFNEFYEIAEKLGVEYVDFRELLLLDGRIERMHTAVFPDKRGFGGKCFPKDVNAIVKHMKDTGYEPKLLQCVLERNAEFTAMNDEKVR